jgi:uncharacterized protein YqgV (UPF0045/DUF77 family)
MISCQISYYPLRQTELNAGVHEVLDIIQDSGLSVDVGKMSTVVSGETAAVYRLLQKLTEAMAAKGREFVLSITVSTSCPL